MFTLCNIRKEEKDDWAYLVCDLKVSGKQKLFKEETIWIAVEKENEDMLSTKVYDPFILVPLFLGMYYGHNVHVEGNVSARFYYNIKHYLMNIFLNFHDETKPIQFTVDGYDTVEDCDISLVGTSISCGVDCLTTIYDNYVEETNPKYRISGLFFANCGSHGKFNEASRTLWLNRAKLNRRVAQELNLPMYLIDSNLHYFVWKFSTDQTIGYLATYSCILALQKYVRRYLMAGNLQYDEIAEFKDLSKNFDISEYCESYMPHLISTEKFELLTDGCQYTRGEKIERISEWEIAQSYLNVCVSPDEHGENCSNCNKCMWTLLPLEAMGQLDKFEKVFDISMYKKNSRKWKMIFASHEGKDAMETSIFRYCTMKGMDFPIIDQTTELVVLKDEVEKLRREINQFKYRERNIVVYGCGQRFRENFEALCEATNICAVVDSDSKIWKTEFNSHTCVSPDEILNIEEPLIIVTVANRRDFRLIKKDLMKKGIKDVIDIAEWIEVK